MSELQSSASDRWTRAETLAKISSLIAIPIVIAVIGWLVQDKLASRTVNKDYVQLAVSILSQPKQTGIDPALRSWAVQLLNENSPVKFSPEVAVQLSSGGVTLPALQQSENLRALAGSYADTGNYTKAEKTLLEALALQKKEFGTKHPSVAETYSNLGTLYLAMGDLQKAEENYKQALALREIYYGPTHTEVARLLSTLATVFDAKGDNAKGQALRERANAIYSKAQSK